MSDSNNDEKRYLNLGEKIAYGCGDMGSNFFYTMVNSFFMLYITNALGLNTAIIGTLMLVSKIFDGVTDVFFGSLMDRTKTRWGKARPWILWSMIPLAVCEVLLFSVPGSAPETFQYVYIFVLYTVINALCYTANNLSYSSMSALITKNGNERVQLGSFRFIMAMIASVFLSSYTVKIVDYFGNDASAWRTTALIYAGCLIVLETICFLFCKEIPSDVQEEQKEHKKISIINDFKLLLTNKFFIRILLYYFFMYMGSGIIGGCVVYYALYVLNNASYLGVLQFSSQVPVMLCLMATPFIVKKFGTYKVNLIGRLFGIICTIGIVIFGLQNNVVGMIVFVVLNGLLSSPMIGTLSAVTADAAEYSLKKDGRHIEGCMFSCSSIGVKVGSGIGTAICGWLLAAGGFDGMAQTQTPGALNMISFMYLGLQLIDQIILFVIAASLNVDKANAELDEKTGKTEVTG